MPHRFFRLCLLGWQFRSRISNTKNVSQVISRSVLSMPGPKLTPSEVTGILRLNDMHIDIKEFEQQQDSPHYKEPCIKSVSSNQLPSNRPIEDRRSLARCMFSDKWLFGVFDGHGGTACAQALSERLFPYIAGSLLDEEELQYVSEQIKEGNNIDIVEWFRHSRDYKDSYMESVYMEARNKFIDHIVYGSTNVCAPEDLDASVAQAMYKAHLHLDNDMCAEAMQGLEDALEVAQSGSCAITALISSSSRDLFVANAGDCRAVLGRIDGNGKWEAVPLSNSHNVYNENELTRILSAHPGEANTVLRQDRLLGALAPLRTFSNFRFKLPLADIRHLEKIIHKQTGVFTPLVMPGYKTPPYLTAAPEVTHHKIDPFTDKFLVLASDGLWDCFNNATVEHFTDELDLSDLNDGTLRPSLSEQLNPSALQKMTEEATIDRLIVRLIGGHMLGIQALSEFQVPPGDPRTLGEVHAALVRRKQALQTKVIDSNPATHLIRVALGGPLLEGGAREQHNRLSTMLSYPPSLSRMYRDDITVMVIFFDSAEELV